MAGADIHIRREGRAGRITLTRAPALNALTWDMVRAIQTALSDWAANPDVAVVVLDAEGAKAFCAGGDVSDLYHAARAGDLEMGRRFWRDEYRLNATIFAYPKPVISFLHGYTLGGGVGVGCHGSHRIVNDTSRIGLPEVSIGLLPDVGSTLMLHLAPGRLGEYLGAMGVQMGPGDAIYAGFADHYIPDDWDALKAQLCETGDVACVERAAAARPASDLEANQAQIDALFGGETLGDIARDLRADGGAFARTALERMARNAPLSMACAVEVMHRITSTMGIERCLELEYRFTHRAFEHGDFLEGIRAMVIDKDKAPKWRHGDLEGVPSTAVAKMLMPLGKDALKL